MLLAIPGAVRGQTIGPSPPTITTTTNVTSGTATVVGNTAIETTLATHATNVSGGTLILDGSAGPTPGPISVRTLNGNALQASGGTITVPNGNLTLFTQGGHAVLANGAASSVQLNGVAITTTGVGSALAAISGVIDATNVVINNTATAGPSVSAGHGAIAEAGGTVNLHSGTSITTAAFNSVAFGASGAGSRVIADTLIPVTVNGRGSMGVYVHDGGQVLLPSNSVLNFNATSSIGVSVDNTTVLPGTIGSGLTVNFNAAGVAGQPGGTGVVAFNNGSITLENLTVTGPNTAAGAWARASSNITLTGRSVINVNSEQNPTFYTLQTPYLVTPAGNVGSIFSVTSAIPVSGLLAQGAGAVITSIGTTINVTSGNGAAGADAGIGGLVDMTDNTITTTGPNSFGVRVDSDGRVVGRDSQIATSGGGAALFINGGPGSIDLTNTAALATGTDTAGLVSLNLSAVATNTVNLTGGSLISTNDTAVIAQGPLALTANRTTLTGGGGFLLIAYNNIAGFQPTAVQFQASNGSTLTGDALVQTQSIANINLSTNSSWTGAAFDVTNISLDTTSRWTITANSTVTQNTANAGLIQFTSPVGDLTQLASYKSLTTQNYIGAGGAIGLNTFLGTDGSPSDRLIINGGRASGVSSLLIANTIGPGDLTRGNGILVVDAINGGTTDPGSFALSRAVLAGPYEYTLHRSSADASGPQNWYLRSTLNPDPPVPPEPPVPPGPPPIPDYRREVSLYAALPAMGLLYGRTLMDSLHERVGELRSLEEPVVTEERTVWCKNPEKNFRCTTTAQTPASNSTAGRSYASASWARIIGTRGNHDGGSIFSNGPAFDYKIYGLQAGLDIYRNFNADGSRDYVGVYAAIGRIQGNVTHFNGIWAGINTIDGYSLGAYWTHFGPSGWYLDGIVQGTWFDATADSQRLIKLKWKSFGFAASLEGGYPIALGRGWIIEPQAQLVYQTLVNGSGYDSAALVRFSDVNSLAGRLGARIAKTWSLEESAPHARLMTAWLKVSVWNEFLGNPKTSFSSATGFIPFSADLGGAWAEIKAGADAQVSKNTSLYASAGYSVGFNGRSHSYNGRLGIKVVW
ncbi:outer membrane autotransporter barrel domain-containing protein [Beijerinckia sp. 28-YEA-48]|nr:outer membrane autotransporter barrel domain-containing protein [Beijerinckia sp. 28-YEA-48]